MNGLVLASEMVNVGKVILLFLTVFPDLVVPAVILTFLRPVNGKDFVEPGEIFLMVFPTL